MVMLDISYIPKPSGRAKTPVRQFIDKTITAIGPQKFFAYHLTALAMEKYPDLKRAGVAYIVQEALRQASEQGVIVKEAVAGDAECVGVKYRYRGVL